MLAKHHKILVLLSLFASLGKIAVAAENRVEALADPIPEIITKGDIAVAIEPFIQIPRTEDPSNPPSTNSAHARIQYMLPIQDGSGRLIINDVRGLLYVTDESGSTIQVYLDLRIQDVPFDNSTFPNETGLLGFAFHPEFGQPGKPGYGKFYTAHSAPMDSGVANYLEEEARSHDDVIWEWTAIDATANEFSGSGREIFRVGQYAQNHNIGSLAFNYAATEESSDYGMLYASFGDAGGQHDPNEYGQSLADPISTVIRIDPLGGVNGASYGIPPDNPFVGQEGLAPEIWVYGFRHPQHFTFDNDGTMYINDIGQNQIEEVNIGLRGGNYGWRLREGTFATAFGHEGVRPGPAYPRPEDPVDFIYPVAQYDHDEGQAIGSGFVYRGLEIPQLYGKYLFADIVLGRVFYVDSSELEAGNPAQISELRLLLNGTEINVNEELGFPNTYSGSPTRAGLRLGKDSHGELYILTKGNGWIHKLTPAP